MHYNDKDTKKFYVSGNISFKWLFILTVLARAMFRTQPKVYGKAFLTKIVNNF